jgi:alpha-mannosidase
VLAEGDAQAPVNTLPWPRREVVVTRDGGLALADAPATGIGAVVDAGPDDAVRLEPTADGGAILENAHLRAVITAGGEIASLVDTATGREALSAPANRLELYEDRPTAWDAWDLPARRPRPRGDVRDRVRRGPPPDALLHQPRPRALRGSRPPLGRRV